ncbi:MAG TPA: GNAT family N-acetyltransferase, partial [Polyangiaceae bacterium]|nr:GNAT family N-acetyltransferase [Polyangiaceae bacterium]
MIFTYVFKKWVPHLGEVFLRPLHIPEDIPLVHDWVRRDHAKYWGMQGKSIAEVEAAYREITRPEHASALLGFVDGLPAFLVERYRSMDDPIAGHYEVRPGDYGMHVLVAPSERRIPNFTWHVFTTIMDFLFSAPAVHRVVVEPDARNEKIHILNRRAGFEYQKAVELPATSVQPAKTAFLFFCTREQYAVALKSENSKMNTSELKVDRRISGAPSPRDAVVHLRPQTWSLVNTQHVRKILSEFAHELLIRPKLQYTEAGWGHYVVETDQVQTAYLFRAQILSLDHWHIDPRSIRKLVNGEHAELDSVSLILELSESLGIDPAMLPTYMEEITSTLYGSAYKYENQRFSARELTRAEFQDVETSMTEGHPSFVANNGRIGFDARDYRAYAPEAASPVSLIWLAAHKSKASFAAIDGLSYEALVEQELDAKARASFRATLEEQGLDPESYLLMPVHPWQWYNKLASIFAPDIA